MLLDLVGSGLNLLLEELEQCLELANDFDLILSVRENVAKLDPIGHLHQRGFTVD